MRSYAYINTEEAETVNLNNILKRRGKDREKNNRGRWRIWS